MLAILAEVGVLDFFTSSEGAFFSPLPTGAIERTSMLGQTAKCLVPELAVDRISAAHLVEESGEMVVFQPPGKTITNTILGVRYNNYSIMGPKTLF